MNREHFYSIMNGEGTLDYELYLHTKTLLSTAKLNLTSYATPMNCNSRWSIR